MRFVPVLFYFCQSKSTEDASGMTSNSFSGFYGVCTLFPAWAQKCLWLLVSYY